MSDNPDLIIRGGTVVDGSGGPTIEADVAGSNGQIIAEGQVRQGGWKRPTRAASRLSPEPNSSIPPPLRAG